MRRPFVLSCALLPALITFLPAAAPVPKERRNAPVLHHPARVGDTRIYQQGESEFTTVVTAVEDGDGAKLITVEQIFSHGYVTSGVLAVSEKGLALAHHGESERDWLLRLPVKDGAGWEVNYPVGPHEYRAAYTVHGPERVAVPAGTFDAIRVEATFAYNGRKSARHTYWYAPGLGEVKWACGDHVRVLKSFTPGKG